MPDKNRDGKEKIQDRLDTLDARGFFPLPGETADAFLARAEKMLPLLSGGPLPDEPLFRNASPIPREILLEGAERTQSLFGFTLDSVRGFFPARNLGPLWGGYAVCDENGQTFFLLRKEFLKKKQWLFYERAELLAHEQCHAARTAVGDDPYDELFAYQTSHSSLRRSLGGCFRTQADSILFLAGIFLLMTAEILVFSGIAPDLPLPLFLFLSLLWPAILLCRNRRTRNRYSRAERKLKKAGFQQAGAILFRATAEEIETIADTPEEKTAETAAAFARKELRWKIALRRFSKKSASALE